MRATRHGAGPVPRQALGPCSSRHLASTQAGAHPDEEDSVGLKRSACDLTQGDGSGSVPRDACARRQVDRACVHHDVSTLGRTTSLGFECPSRILFIAALTRGRLVIDVGRRTYDRERLGLGHHLFAPQGPCVPVH